MFPMHNDIYLRLGFFFGIFGMMAVFELIAPRKLLVSSKSVRWFNNLTITFMNATLLRLIYPIMAIDVSYISADRGWGIFNNVAVPEIVAGILCVVALDFFIYVQHMVFHIVGPFWRLHRMHHTDIDIDVTTGARFHPIEIILSMGIKMASVIILGAPAWSVLVFEILLNATSMFNHANVYIPVKLDRFIRLFLVTPDMHRVHHSVIIKETNSNYGFNLPWWDRLFRTYRAQPIKGHADMKIGLANYRDPGKLTLSRILIIPFTGPER